MKDHLKKDINTDEEEIEDITEDVEFEELDNEGDELDNNGKVKKLREKIKKLEEEKKEYLDLSQRLRADYANLKKEVEENRSKTIKLANRGLMEDILPVLDSYTMAQGNKEAWEKVDQNWRIGIEYIFNQLSSVLEGNGLVSFGNVGENPNPNIIQNVL